MATRERKPTVTRARKRHEAEAEQPPLFPMTKEETDKAGRTLAEKIAELEELEADHAVKRQAMSEERAALCGKIASIASTIRNQGR